MSLWPVDAVALNGHELNVITANLAQACDDVRPSGHSAPLGSS
jgi:hypothetical protein